VTVKVLDKEIRTREQVNSADHHQSLLKQPIRELIA
jgi:hypothetical protein